MQAQVVGAAAVHVLSAVFWAGSTFALARTGGTLAPRLFGPQMGAAAVAIMSGGYLWRLTQAQALGQGSRVLAVGALGAILAACLQAVMIGSGLRQRRAAPEGDGGHRRIAITYRVSAALLAVTVFTMATARYF